MLVVGHCKTGESACALELAVHDTSYADSVSFREFLNRAGPA
jgi:hypothetical protein